MQIAASGIPSYEDAANIIEILVNTEGKKYPIPGMDFDDIAQEIRLECIRVLKFYDHTRIGPSPYKYLQTCVRNFLYNQRRGIWVPNNPPCVRCPLWDKVNRTCKVDEVGCEKIITYRENMAVKADLKRPNSLEIDIIDLQPEHEIDAMFLNNSIKQALNKNLQPYYEKLIAGNDIPARIKRQIRDIAIQVINNAEDIS